MAETSSSPTSKVLVVYDSRTIRDTLCLLDTNPHIHVLESDTPDEAVNLVKTEAPDIVILCAMTGNTHAYALCTRIKEALRTDAPPIMMLAIQDTPAARKRAHEAGADDALQLSISEEDLLFRIRALLLAHEAQRTGAEAGGLHSPAALFLLNQRLEQVLHAVEALTRTMDSHEKRMSSFKARLEALERRRGPP